MSCWYVAPTPCQPHASPSSGIIYRITAINPSTKKALCIPRVSSLQANSSLELLFPFLSYEKSIQKVRKTLKEETCSPSSLPSRPLKALALTQRMGAVIARAGLKRAISFK